MIVLTKHAKERMQQRNVSYSQIVEALKAGNVKSNKNGSYVRNFVKGESRAPLQVGFFIEGKKIIVASVYFKGL